MSLRFPRSPATTLALCLGLALGPLTPAGAVSLRDAVSAALSSDPRVSSADAEQRAARLEVRQARGGFFPRVDVSGVAGRERSNIKSLRQSGADDRYLWRREFGVKISQMLYDGLFTASEVERRNALLEAAGGSADGTREQIAFAAVESYLDVLRNRRLVQLAMENVDAHDETLVKVERRLREGVGPRADLSQAQARLALARSVLTAREGGLREAVTRYRRVVGAYPEALEDLAVESPGLLSDGRIDAALLREAIRDGQEQARDSNPALRTAEADVQAADAEKRGSRSAYLPRLDLEVNVNRDGNLSGVSGTRNTDNVLLVGSWNLFRGGSDSAREQALAERHSAAVSAAADTRRAVDERVAIAVQAKATSEERLQYLRQHVDSSEETLRSYEAQLNLGRRTLLDTLNAVNELFTARSNLVSGEYEDILNRYFVEASKGVLASSLDLP